MMMNDQGGNPVAKLVKRVAVKPVIVPLFRGSSRFDSLIFSHHFRFSITCECNKEGINDDHDARATAT